MDMVKIYGHGKVVYGYGKVVYGHGKMRVNAHNEVFGIEFVSWVWTVGNRLLACWG